MKFKRENSSSIQPAINTTPLLDVVFILLIFFAVSTSFLYAGAIKVDLPKAQTTVEESSREMVRVVVTKEGNFYVDDAVVSENELRAVLGRAREAKPEATLVIEADTAAMHGKVVQVIDDGKLAGFEKFAIATEEPE